MKPMLVLLVPLLASLQSRPATRPASPPPPSPAGLEKVAALAWLAGHWLGESGDATWEAVYSSPAGGEVVSASKEMRGGRVVMHELERFHAVGDEVLLTPHPLGQARADFRLIELDEAARKAVFENAPNDFPRRLVYHRTAEDTLTITLIGTVRGQPREQAITLKRHDQ